MIMSRGVTSMSRVRWWSVFVGIGALLTVLALTAFKQIALQPHASLSIQQDPVGTHLTFFRESESEPGTVALGQQDGCDRTAFSLVPQPPADLCTAVQALGIQAQAYAAAPPFPAISAQARLARVPVFMYHDVLPEKKVFFDVTPEELRQDFELIRQQQLTPITMDQLVTHLRTGLPLPAKPILLSFDDGYAGHYQHVFPLLKEFGYPASFGIFTAKPDGTVVGRSTVTWEQLQEMAASPLVTIASHSVTHPPDLRALSPAQITQEVTESKRILEEHLGVPIRYFVYPAGYYDPVVIDAVDQAGYTAALTMDHNSDGSFAEQSESVLAIARFGQSSFKWVAPQANGGAAITELELKHRA